MEGRVALEMMGLKEQRWVCINLVYKRRSDDTCQLFAGCSCDHCVS